MSNLPHSSSSVHRRVALASSDGQSVNQHLSSAAGFFVYDFDGQEFHFAEERKNTGEGCGCHRPQGCGLDTFKELLQGLEDCHVVVAERMGGEAAVALLEQGIRGFLAQGPFEQVLQRLGRASILRVTLPRRPRALAAKGLGDTSLSAASPSPSPRGSHLKLV